MRLIVQVLLAVSVPFTIVAQQPADSVARDTGLSASARPTWDDQEEYRTGTRFSDLLVVRAGRAGWRVSPAAGTLGLVGRVRLRGPQTFFDDRLPLVILDGMRLDAASGFLGGTPRLEDINPDDILSIELVSPAQGVRSGPDAANGVIIVRTREGADGKPEWRGYVDVGTRTPVDHWPIRMGGFDANSPDSSFRNGGCTLVLESTNQCTQDSIAVLLSPLTRQFGTAIRRQYGLSATGGWAQNRYYVAGESDGDGSPFALSADEVDRLQSIGQTVPGTVRHPQHVGNGNLTANIRLRPVAAISVDLHGLHVSQDLRAPAFVNESANSFGLYALQAGLIAPGDAFQVQTVSSMSRWLGSVDVAWTPIQALTVTGSLGQDGVRFASDREGGPGVLSESVVLNSATRGLAADVNWGPRSVELRSHIGLETSRVNRDSTECASGTSPNCTSGAYRKFEQFYQQRFWSLVLEQRAWIRDRLELAAVLRRDHFKEHDQTATHPAIHAAWWGTPVRVRVDYGSTSRRPFFFPKPERTKELSAGVDVTTASDRLTVGGTIYDMHSRAYAVAVVIPSGGPPPLMTGTIGNRGIELYATARLIDRPNATLTVETNAWGNRNRLLSMSLPIAVPGPGASQERSSVGLPVGGYWAYRPPTFADANGNGIIEPNEASWSNQVTWAGTPYPTQGATLAPQLSFRSIRVGTSFDYQAGHTVFNRSLWVACLDAHCPAAVDPRSPLAAQADALLSRFGPTTRYFEDGDFLAWRELWVTLNVPPRFANALHVKSASVTLAGRNLHTWTGYSGISPDPYAVDPLFGEAEGFSEPLMPALPQWSLRLRVSY